MISGSVLRDFYVAMWRAIPGIVDAMNGDEGKIRANNAIAPIASSLSRQVMAMIGPQILVAYQGSSRGEVRRNEITKHHIAAFIRAASDNDDDHIDFNNLMCDVIPSGESQVVRYLEPHPDADAMDMPKFERVGASDLPFDIWKLSFSIPERAG